MAPTIEAVTQLTYASFAASFERGDSALIFSKESAPMRSIS